MTCQPDQVQVKSTVVAFTPGSWEVSALNRAPIKCLRFALKACTGVGLVSGCFESLPSAAAELFAKPGTSTQATYVPL